MWPFNLSSSVKVLMQWGHWSSFLFSLFCWPFVVCHIWIHSQNCGVRICDSRFWVKFHFCARLIFGPPHPQSFWVELLELCDSQTKNWTRYLKSFPLFVGCLKLMKLILTISGRSTKNHHIGWNKWWQNRHTNCHQNWWLFHHLNYHQFRQIPKKITLWGETKSDKIATWIFTKYGDHTITLIITNSGRSPQKSP